MAQTRGNKRASLAFALTDAQSNHSAFIRLPVEIRYMIYKLVWTPAVLPWEYERQAQCEGQPVRDHIKQIHLLTSVCRHFRYEVIAEYFSHAQAHIFYAAGIPKTSLPIHYDMRVLTAMRYIKRSLLFKDHLQHVRLNWLPADRFYSWDFWFQMVARGRYNSDMVYASEGLTVFDAEYGHGKLNPTWKPHLVHQMESMRWLASLKSLKTLEIIFLDAPRYNTSQPQASAMIPLYDTPEWQKLRSRRKKPEVVTLRAWSSRPKAWKRSQGGEKMDEALKGLSKDPKAKQEEYRQSRIDIHVGAVGPCESSN